MIGTAGGLTLIENGTLSYLTRQNGLTDNRITCILGHPNKEGTQEIWIGTENGLNRLDPETREVKRFTTADGLAGNIVEFLMEDGNGNLLIGTDNGLTCLINDSLSSCLPPLSGQKSWFICGYRDSKGVFWFGTKNGVIRWKGNETYLFTVNNGLIENEISSILEDGGGNLWFTGGNGISRVSKSSLNAVADGSTGSLQTRWFNEEDGMFSRWCTAPGYKSRNGAFWFPTSVGVATIDPDRIKTNTLEPPAADRETGG